MGYGVIKNCAEQRVVVVNEDEDDDIEEDEEELFEINLEAANSIPPPPHNYWESYFFTGATGNALLANCLLPIDDLSGAIPIASSSSITCNNNALSVSGISKLLVISSELLVPAGKQLVGGFPTFEVLEFQF